MQRSLSSDWDRVYFAHRVYIQLEVEVTLGCDLVCATATRKPLPSLDTTALSTSLC